jgi:hypothetical protein
VIGIQKGPADGGFTMASRGGHGAARGMLIVETIAKVRRAYFLQKKPIRAICREVSSVAQSRAQGDPVRGERIPL